MNRQLVLQEIDSKMKKKEILELKTDLKLLLECLDYQKDDTAAVKQALVTISSMLQSSGEAKDVFRDIGGIQHILKLVTNHGENEVVEAGLYCLGCAVERNVYSQKLLTTASVFTFLHGVLSSSCKTTVRKKQTASFLLLCLVSNNGFGQNLVRQSSCLQDILSLIRTSMPRNIEDLDSDWFEGMDGKSLHLWSTLLSTACACVNNPINEGNQRICASLLPYLFSLLTNQSHERILRPIFSLIGLTVSGNENNQDRVRKCGGLDIFVKKLDSLQSEAVCNITAKHLSIQLLSTVDACISDNEKNSRSFGQLGGIKQVLTFLADCCLDTNEKIQAVLTLAHALDAYKGNQKYVRDCGGVTILIQQLTETQDEEFCKTIKYLLHMCVASEKGSLKDIETDLTDTERLINKMEAMKKHNDVEMLRKIRELDCKVKSMENKHQKEFSHNEFVTTNLNNISERFEIPCTTSPHNVEPARSRNSSIGESSIQQDCPTPREKSLMEQLIKEKVEKERLEKLNYMLQENICKTHTALTNAGVENKPDKSLDISNQQQTSSNVHTSTETVSCNINGRYTSPSSNKFCSVSSTCFDANNKSDLLPCAQNTIVSYTDAGLDSRAITTGTFFHQNRSRNDECVETNFTDRAHEISPMVTRSGLRYHQSLGAESRNIAESFHCNNNSVVTSQYNKQNCDQFDRNKSISNINQNEGNRMVSNKQISLSLTRNLNNECIQAQKTKVENRDSLPFVAKPLDLSYSSKTTLYDSNIEKNNNEITVTTTVARDNVDQHPSTKGRTTKINKNAEIQCGTPWVSKNSEYDLEGNESCCSVDGSSQTNFSMQKNNINSSQEKEKPKNKRLLIDKGDYSDKNLRKFETTKNSDCHNDKTPVVLLTDCSSSANQRKQHDTITTFCASPSVLTTSSEKSYGLFVKPVALPPKRKIRVTPLLGCDKHPASSLLSSKKSRHCDINNSSLAVDYDSDIQSEFDLNLIKNVARKQIPVKSTPVIRSQNNVKQIDRVVEKREGNAAEKWQIHPSTPHRQGIVPLRPAFSDCGTRRCVLSGSFSVNSQGTRRRSLDDSGIHSPRDILTISPKSPDGSPVDSNIDGFRSNSDISDEDEGPPNISAAVLRSSKKLVKDSENNCPGCTGFYSVNQARAGSLELNSRTYNIALETNQNTCMLHRKLRQVERVYINKIRKSKGMRSKLKRKLQYKLPSTKQCDKPPENVYEFSSDSADNISPPSGDDNECLPPSRRKKRRKRIPYTEQEENNLLEGVRVLGKHWNQILVTYDFHPARTNVDLMDKYKRLRASNNQDTTSSKCQSMISRPKTLKPFSMCEERRLRRGIMKFGYNWKTILSSLTFAQGTKAVSGMRSEHSEMLQFSDLSERTLK